MDNIEYEDGVIYQDGIIIEGDNVYIGVRTKRMSETAKLPTYGSDKAACCDLYADFRDDSQVAVAIPPHTTIKVGTGWAFQPPPQYCGLIFARSGLATKEGLRPANCVGVADEDYRGEYIVALHNDSSETKYICQGDRIAQLCFLPYIQAKFFEVDNLDETERGAGGFGSTGK